MNFYTSVIQHGKFLLVRKYKNGQRFSEKIPFKPYLFFPSKTTSEYRTLFGEPVSKMDFPDIWEAKQFIKQYEDVHGFSTYGMTRWPYVYIHDNFPGTIQYDTAQIKVLGIDIEVDTEDGYPNIELADKMITAITVRMKNKKVVFGYKDFDPPENVTYIKCVDEVDLLTKFLILWNTPEWNPDVVTGWNIEGFDIPYLVIRITNKLGEEQAKKLSPWGILNEKKIFMRGRETTIFIPLGIAILDYMALYKKYTYNEQSSYALNNIAHIELDERKIDYSEYVSLADLYVNNPQKFYEYNIHDVDLIFKLEDKLRFIELVFAIAYDAKVNFNDAFTSVLLWDIIIYNYLMDKNIVIPQPLRTETRAFEGGFVKEPKVGMHEWVMSFDLTSLYPHLIIQYNISPETFVRREADFSVERLLEKEPPVFDGNSLTANGCLYRNDIRGFLPELMELQFNLRTEYKDKMKEAKIAKNENDIAKYNMAQMAKKIQLNSLYGSLSNAGFRFYDINHAEAITLSGQLSIRYMEKKINEFMNMICQTEDKDYVIAVDTDSLYISFGYLVKKYCKNSEKSQIVDFLNKVSIDKIEPFMQKQYDILAKRMNAYTNAMHMKRENIGDKAIWVAKKRYMMNVWDSEGLRYEKPELKMMGIETARSSTPEICRKALEKSIEIIMNGNESMLQNYVETVKNEFYSSPFDVVAFPRTANNLNKYQDSATIYKKGTPIHVKGSLLYNKLLKDRNIKKWPPIFESEKIKFSYLKLPNPVKDTVIAAPGYLPFVDVESYIDYATQFEKSFLEPLNHILELIGWTHKETDSLEGLFE